MPDYLGQLRGGSLRGGVSCPASHRRTLLALLAESLWAKTEPAEPPPTMMMSYTFGISLGLSREGSLRLRITPVGCLRNADGRAGPRHTVGLSVSLTSGSGPGRVKTFFLPPNCTQPGAIHVDAIRL